MKVIENVQREGLESMGVSRALVALKKETGRSHKGINLPRIISKVRVGRLLALLENLTLYELD